MNLKPSISFVGVSKVYMNENFIDLDINSNEFMIKYQMSYVSILAIVGHNKYYD